MNDFPDYFKDNLIDTISKQRDVATEKLKQVTQERDEAQRTLTDAKKQIEDLKKVVDLKVDKQDSENDVDEDPDKDYSYRDFQQVTNLFKILEERHAREPVYSSLSMNALSVDAWRRIKIKVLRMCLEIAETYQRDQEVSDVGLLMMKNVPADDIKWTQHAADLWVNLFDYWGDASQNAAARAAAFAAQSMRSKTWLSYVLKCYSYLKEENDCNEDFNTLLENLRETNYELQDVMDWAILAVDAYQKNRAEFNAQSVVGLADLGEFSVGGLTPEEQHRKQELFDSVYATRLKEAEAICNALEYRIEKILITALGQEISALDPA